MIRALRTLIFGDKFRLLLVTAAVFCSASFAQSRSNGYTGGDYGRWREEEQRRQVREWEAEVQRRRDQDEAIRKLGPPPACGIRVFPFEAVDYNRPFRVSPDSVPGITKLLEAKKYIVVDQEKYKGTYQTIPYSLDVNGSIGSYDLDVKVEFILRKMNSMTYLYNSKLAGKVSCNSWHGFEQEFSDASGFLFGWTIYSRYYNRCDDGLDRSYYITKRITQALLKRISEMPDCPDASKGE